MKAFLIIVSLTLSANFSAGQSLYDLYLSQGIEHVRSGEYDRASYYLDKGIKHYPDSSDLYTLRAYNRHYLNLPDSSIADLLKAEELGSKSEFIPKFLGLNYNEIGEFELAEEHYREYLKIVPGDSDILIGLVTLVLDREDFSEAEELTLDFKKAYPTAFVPAMLLGLISHKRELYLEAIEYFTEFIELTNGNDPYGYLHRSYSFKALGKFNEMCEDLWSIRYNYETGGSRVYYDEGCEAILDKQILPPPQEDIPTEETPPPR